MDEVRKELQRLGKLLHVQTGLFNVEWRVCKDGKVYLMEVSPRAGGNRLAEILNYAVDVDIIEAEVCKAIGEPIPFIHEPYFKDFYAIYVLHSQDSGRFKELRINADFKRKYVIEDEIRVIPDQIISSFSGANAAIGTLFLRFNTREELYDTLKNINEYTNILII